MIRVFLLTLPQMAQTRFYSPTGESWQTGADETRCRVVAEAAVAKLRQRPVEEDVRALVAAAAVHAGILLALVHVHLTVVSTVTCREEP